MPSKKEIKEKIAQGNFLFLNEYLILEYEEYKEKLVDLINLDDIKKAQGTTQYLRDLIKLTSKK